MARQYKTGWVYATNWNQVLFGDSPGQAITHGFGVTPENITARVYLKTSSPGTVYEVVDGTYSVYADDDDTSTISVRNRYSNAVEYKVDTGAHLLVYNGTGAWYQVVLDNTAEEIGSQGPTGPQGPQGPQGESGTTTVVYARDWDSATSYSVGDLVYYDGNVYKCIQASTNNQPDTSATYWDAIPQTYTTETEPNAVDGSLWIKE